MPVNSEPTSQRMTALVSAAARGDRAAATEILEAVQDDVYGLSLRMLGHPADAEDAAQEILLVVLTHLGSFRGESAFRSWVWRIAANHLARAKRGRRETITFDTLDERLTTGLRDEPPRPLDPESDALARELRLRCTEAMLLCLDRELRIAYVLGDVFGLSGDDGAEVLEIAPATFRKRLSRARVRLHDFLRGWCGVYAAANPCRCARQVRCAVERGLVAPDDLDLSRQRTRPHRDLVARAAEDVGEMLAVAEAIRGPARYAAPDGLLAGLRELLNSSRWELLRES
jgi:RNA polymerase sigma factor (sigma-70 family)